MSFWEACLRVQHGTAGISLQAAGGGQQGMGNGHLLLWRREVGTDEGDETRREIGQRKC